MRFLGVLVLVALAACNKSLVVHSYPTGALIFDAYDGRTMGVAPVRLEYPNSANSGCFMANALKARWPSGAETTTQLVSLCHQANEITISRDAYAPGAELDLINATSQQAARDAAAMRDIERNRNFNQALQNSIQTMQRTQQQVKQIDYTCMSDCNKLGYLYQYCQSACSY